MPSHYNHPDESFKVTPDINPNPLTSYGESERRNDAWMKYINRKGPAAFEGTHLVPPIAAYPAKNNMMQGPNNGGSMFFNAGEEGMFGQHGGFTGAEGLDSSTAKVMMGSSGTAAKPESNFYNTLFEFGSSGGGWAAGSDKTPSAGGAGAPPKGSTQVPSIKAWQGKGEADASKHGGTDIFPTMSAPTHLGGAGWDWDMEYNTYVDDKGLANVGTPKEVVDKPPSTPAVWSFDTWLSSPYFKSTYGHYGDTLSAQIGEEYYRDWWQNTERMPASSTLDLPWFSWENEMDKDIRSLMGGSASKNRIFSKIDPKTGLKVPYQVPGAVFELTGIDEQNAKMLTLRKWAAKYPNRKAEFEAYMDMSLTPIRETPVAGANGSLHKKPKKAGDIGSDANTYIENVNRAIGALASGGFTIDKDGAAVMLEGDKAPINQLIKMTEAPLAIPDEYTIVTDPTSKLPVLKYVGAYVYMKDTAGNFTDQILFDEIEDPTRMVDALDDAGNKIIDPETGQTKKEPKKIKLEQRDLSKGRLSAAEEAAWNSALQQKEIALGHIADYSEAAIGLNIDAQRLNMTSKEFRDTLGHKVNELALEKSKYESNDRFTEATITGLFTDADGKSVDTLSRQELTAKLTGEFVSGYETKTIISEGKKRTYKNPIMSETVAMKQMRADLTGIFEVDGEDTDTITKTQVMAELTGYLTGKDGDNPQNTFVRDQFEELKRQSRSEWLNEAGVIAIEGLAKFDPNTGEVMIDDNGQVIPSDRAKALIAAGVLTLDKITGDVAYLNNLAKAQGELQDALVIAKETGQLMVPIWGEDDFGNRIVVDHQETATVAEKIRIFEETRVTHMQDMQLSTLAHEETITDHAINKHVDANLAALGYVRLPTYDKDGNLTFETIENLSDPSLRKTMAGEMHDAQLTAMKSESGAVEIGPGQSFWDDTKAMEGDTWQERFSGEQALLEDARQYTSILRGAMQNLTNADMTDSQIIQNLDVAINSPLPMIPAGMVWDAAGGTLKLRQGYEGSIITPEIQRSMEIVIPALKARDRAEQIMQGLLQFHQQQVMINQQMSNSSARLKELLMDGNIASAEKEAYLKQKAERELAEWEVKSSKWQVVLNMISNPLMLGMAQRNGLLYQLEADLGINIPHVPEAGAADSVPTYNEWQTMDTDDKQFRLAIWEQETGQPADAFHRLVLGTAPAQVQTMQYATLGL